MKKFSIDIVDNDIFYLNILNKTLTNLNVGTINKYSKSSEFLKQLKNNSDLVIVDYDIDELNGFDILIKIKNYNSNIYVIILSAQLDLELKTKVEQHGAFKYIQKGKNSRSKIEEAILEIKKNQTILGVKKAII